MPANLTLSNYSDRELLHVIADLTPADGDGWVDVDLIATRLGLSQDGLSEEQAALHARRCTSVRLSWVQRLSGTVEKNEARKYDQPPQWRLTDEGNLLVKAKLSPAEIEKLEETISDYSALGAVAALSRRYQRTATGRANLLRREWAYGTHKNRKA